MWQFNRQKMKQLFFVRLRIKLQAFSNHCWPTLKHCVQTSSDVLAHWGQGVAYSACLKLEASYTPNYAQRLLRHFRTNYVCVQIVLFKPIFVHDIIKAGKIGLRRGLIDCFFFFLILAHLDAIFWQKSLLLFFTLANFALASLRACNYCLFSYFLTFFN